MVNILARLQQIEHGELVPRDTRPHAAAEDFVAGEAEIRRSERLRVLEVLARHVPTGSYARAAAAVRREIGE